MSTGAMFKTFDPDQVRVLSTVHAAHNRYFHFLGMVERQDADGIYAQVYGPRTMCLGGEDGPGDALVMALKGGSPRSAVDAALEYSRDEERCRNRYRFSFDRVLVEFGPPYDEDEEEDDDEW